jgi:5-methylcytosine-specific restriction protein B
MGNAYQWVPFYEALADKLFTYSDKRDDLHDLMKKLAAEQPLMKYLHFEREDWWGPHHHRIDPFSVMGVINLKTTDANRIVLAKEFASVFDIQAPVPRQFWGIPILNNMNSFFNVYKWQKPDKKERRLSHERP